MSDQFVGYFRVSTDRQGRSGLGLEAQRDAVLRHLAGVGGRLQGEFVEIESGKRNDRPQLAAAIAATKKAKATLIIAKLDRLARNVHFVLRALSAHLAGQIPQALGSRRVSQLAHGYG